MTTHFSHTSGILSGAHALITGATGGIGQAIASAMHQNGAHVHISGRRENVLKELAEKLGDRVSIWPMDVADSGSIDACVAGIKSAEIPLNIVINNAGITRDNLALRIKDEDWLSVVQTNLTSCFQLSRGLYSLLSKAPQKYARIINISSIVGFSGNAGQANYAAAKAGMIGLTKTLALEWASRSITVNAIAPGYIATPMTEKFSEETTLLNKIPCKRMGKPEEIAFAALFLADARAGYITGQTLHVNGGLGMF